MLVSVAAEQAGVDEQRVRDAALKRNEVARLRRLPDGRWVVAADWAEARLSLVKEA